MLPTHRWICIDLNTEYLRDYSMCGLHIYCVEPVHTALNDFVSLRIDCVPIIRKEFDNVCQVIGSFVKCLVACGGNYF